MSRDLKFRCFNKDDDYGMFYGGFSIHATEGKFQPDSLLNDAENGDYVVMQFAGVQDCDGKPIFEGDILNICFTSDSGTFIHDGIYTANIDTFNGVNFRFNNLLWIDNGHNQYPMNMNLNSSNKLGSVYAESGDQRFLCVCDEYMPDCEKPNSYPFNNEKELKFNSRYFKIIGNIYENPELIKG